MTDRAPQPLPSGRRGLDPDEVLASQRTRLLDAMVWLATERGFDAVTIGDLTARARTAKRTFYAHFDDREGCFLAAYAQVDEAAFEVLLAGAVTQTEPLRRIEAGLGALLEHLAERPRDARLWLLESRAAGQRAVAARLQTEHRLAELYLALHAQIAHTLDPPVPMTRVRALGVVGALDLPMSTVLQEEGAGALPALAGELARAAYTLVYGTAPPS